MWHLWSKTLGKGGSLPCRSQSSQEEEELKFAPQTSQNCLGWGLVDSHMEAELLEGSPGGGRLWGETEKAD